MSCPYRNSRPSIPPSAEVAKYPGHIKLLEVDWAQLVAENQDNESALAQWKIGIAYAQSVSDAIVCGGIAAASGIETDSICQRPFIQKGHRRPMHF